MFSTIFQQIDIVDLIVRVGPVTAALFAVGYFLARYAWPFFQRIVEGGMAQTVKSLEDAQKALNAEREQRARESKELVTVLNEIGSQVNRNGDKLDNLLKADKIEADVAKLKNELEAIKKETK